MKKWIKRLLGVLAALVLLVAVATAWWWREIRTLVDTGSLNGKETAVPKSAGTTLPPLAKGDGDWVCWRGGSGDGRSAVTGIRKDWSGGLRKLWEVGFLCQGNAGATWSAPVVQGNRLVACGRGPGKDLVFCLDSATGGLLWQASYEAEAKSNHGAGPRATPCIDDDRVYTFGRNGDLACWRLLDGKAVWRQNVGAAGGKEPQWGHSSSPRVVGDVVVVQGGGAARVVAYDKLTGKLAWKTGQGKAGYAGLVTMEIDGTRAILAFHGEGLTALSAESGAQLWDVIWRTSYDVNATTPVVSGQNVFITSGYNTGCALLKVTKTGAKFVWRNQVIASHHSDPYLIDGFLYGYSGQSFRNKGAFKCVELKTGEEQWTTDEMGWGTCVYVDEHLLCCDIHGNLYLVKPDPQAFAAVAEWRRALGKIRGPVWTVPVVANGRLYLRFKQRLVCYDIGNT